MGIEEDDYDYGDIVERTRLFYDDITLQEYYDRMALAFGKKVISKKMGCMDL
jgi:hypothetical protein